MPTRLSVAAADFILSLTVALTGKDMVSSSSDISKKSSVLNAKNRPIASLSVDTSDREAKTLSKASELQSSLEMKLLLWDHLDQLMILVQRLTAVCSSPGIHKLDLHADYVCLCPCVDC